MAKRLSDLERHLLNVAKNTPSYNRSNKRGKAFFWTAVARAVAKCSWAVSDPDVIIQNLADADWQSYDTATDFLESYDVKDTAPDLYACMEEERSMEAQMLMYDEQKEEERRERKEELLIQALKEWKDLEKEYTESDDVFMGFGSNIHDRIAKIVRSIITEFGGIFSELYEDEMLDKSSGSSYDERFGKDYGFPAIDFYNKYQSAMITYDSFRREIEDIKKEKKNLKKLIKKYQDMDKQIEEKVKSIEKSGVGTERVEVEPDEYVKKAIEPTEREMGEALDFLRKMRISTLEKAVQTGQLYGKVVPDWELDLILDVIEEKKMDLEEKIREEANKPPPEPYIPSGIKDLLKGIAYQGQAVEIDYKKEMECRYIQNPESDDPFDVLPYLWMSDWLFTQIADARGGGTGKGHINYLKVCAGYEAFKDIGLSAEAYGIAPSKVAKGGIMPLSEVIENSIDSGKIGPNDREWLNNFLSVYMDALKECIGGVYER